MSEKAKSHRKSKQCQLDVINQKREQKRQAKLPPHVKPVMVTQEDPVHPMLPAASVEMVSDASLPSLPSLLPCTSISATNNCGDNLQKSNARVAKARNIVVDPKIVLTSFCNSMPVTNSKQTSNSMAQDANNLFALTWCRSKAPNRRKSYKNPNANAAVATHVDLAHAVPIVSHF